MQLSDFEIFNFIHPILASFIASLVIMGLMTSTAKKALKVRKAPVVKKGITIFFCYAGIPLLFLMFLSFFEKGLFVGEDAALLQKPINKIIGLLINLSRGDWHYISLIVMGAISLGMYLIPNFVEDVFSGFTRHIVYTVLTAGLYLPYKFFCFLFEPSAKESLKRGTKVIHDTSESARLLKKKREEAKV